jgi:hypothetical protein
VLAITIGADEAYDEDKNEFTELGGTVVELEHSLVSLSKWEQIFEKPFLGKGEKTPEEAIGYIRAMIVTPDLPPDILNKLSQENVNEIQAYIEAKMSATWFSNLPKTQQSSEVITSELIYFWMDTFNIKKECETWHLNRLFNLIQIHSQKNSKPKKMSRAEIARRNRELNAKRREELGTSG